MEAVTIIIPVKDEEVGLEYLIKDFKKSNLEYIYDTRFIFVIDHRTSDASRQSASKFSDIIIDQLETTGKAAAVMQAVQHWKKAPTKKTIFLDADGSYSFDSVKKILQELDNGADVVSGSRFHSTGNKPDGMSHLHNFGNKFLSKISTIRNGRTISDLCTGLWGFNEGALMKMNIKSKGFDLEAEIAGIVRINNLRHVEVQVDWSQRKGGVSKLRSLTDGFIIFLRILRT